MNVVCFKRYVMKNSSVMKGSVSRTVARKSSIGGFTFVQVGLKF